jgi:energy-coupling factor transporter ATP-binding protein EcfA2
MPRGGLDRPTEPFSSFTTQQNSAINVTCGQCAHWVNGFCELRKQAVTAYAPLASRCLLFERRSGEGGRGQAREAEALVELPPIAEKVREKKEEGDARPKEQAEAPLGEEEVTAKLLPGVRAVLDIPAFSGVVRMVVSGDSVSISFNGVTARGTLAELRKLAEDVGLREKDLLVLRVALEQLGVRVPGPPLPLDVVEKLPLLTPAERIEVLGWLRPGDLGIEHVLKLAFEEGWLKEEDLVDVKKALRKVPSHAKAYYMAELLERWGLLRVVLLKLAPEGEVGESEGRCVLVGDNLLLGLDKWERAASRFFKSALSREVLSYVKNHAATVASKEIPLEKVNPVHQLRLRGWVLDLRDLNLLPPSLSDFYFTYEVDAGLSDGELRSLVESVKKGDYEVGQNRIYTLWRQHFEDREWEFFIDSVGTFLAPFRFRHVALIVGEKGSGKSSLLAAVTKAIDPLTGKVPLSKLAGEERFAAQPLIGKWVNVYSEQLRPVLRNLEVVNNLVGESDWIFVDRKHKPPIWIRSLKSMVFAANAIPVVQSWSEGVMDAFIDRLSIIMKGKPEGFRAEKEIAEKVPKAESLAFLLWARWQLEQRGWELRKRSEEELLDMLMEAQSPVSLFIEEKCVRDEHGRVARKELYDAFLRWAREHGITRIPSRGEFYAQVRSLGFAEKKTPRERFFIGLRLIKEGGDEQLELHRFEEF